MQRMLQEIQDGTYARTWIAENEQGRPRFTETRAREQEHQIEQVGAKLRAMMPFLHPVTVRPDGVTV
jgi:ketol-acid reductoisomerase